MPVFELSIERALLAGEKPSVERLLPYVSSACAPHAEDVLRIGAWAAVAGLPVQLAALPSTPWEPMLRRDWRAAATEFAAAGWEYDRALMLALVGDEESLVEAIGIAHALGAMPLARRVAQQMRALGLRVPRGPPPEHALEPSRPHRAPAQGARAPGEGLTNADIADRLVVSPRTDEHHVAAVLQKLAAPTRRHAARHAAELGVMQGG